jgi:hypothetical protein
MCIRGFLIIDGSVCACVCVCVSILFFLNFPLLEYEKNINEIKDLSTFKRRLSIFIFLGEVLNYKRQVEDMSDFVKCVVCN